jgi:hypothetical protein
VRPVPKSPLPVVLGFTFALAYGAHGQAVHVVSASEKVYQGDATLPTPATNATIFAAQNEFEGFQIVVTGPASGVSVTANVLTGPQGFRIVPTTLGSRAHIMVYLESFLTIPPPGGTSSDAAGKAGNAPDALIPAFDEFFEEPRNASVANLPAGQNAVFFVDVHVPAAAVPGVYRGTVTVSLNGTNTPVPVSLTVWPFSLDSTPHLKTMFKVNWNAVLTQYPGITCCTAADASMLLLHDILGLNHRVTLSAMDDGNAVPTASGSFEGYDRNFAALINGQANTILAGARPTAILYLGDLPPKTTAATQMQQWHDHFSANGWLDRLIIDAADEPANGANSNWCTLEANASAAHTAGLRAATTTSIQQARAGGCGTPAIPVDVSTINIFIPIVEKVQDPSMVTGQNSLADYTSGTSPWKVGTNEIWEYQSCVSWGCSGGMPVGVYPSYAVDHTAVRSRALEWISFRNGITGEFYWDSTNAWVTGSQAPWTNQYDASTRGNGDGTLVYPGVHGTIGPATGHDIPIASLRLKMLREGVEDYDYMYQLVNTFNEGAFVNAQIDAVFPTASSSGATSSALYTARANMACKIINHLHPTWSCTDPSTWGATCVAPTPDFCPPSQCVDLTSDKLNCGTCGNQCPAPSNGSATCVASACGEQCNTGLTLCASQCVSTSSDPTNCGGCGTVCPSAKPVCSRATCCPSGYTGCGDGTCAAPGTQCF